MSRRGLLNLIAFVGVFVLMLWWAVNNIISFDFLGRPYEIQGEFAATAGVATNSEVAYLGVNHGVVRSVESVDGKVRITMSIDRDKRIPAGYPARIYRKSAIGAPHLNFQPPQCYEDGGRSPSAADPIPTDRHADPGRLHGSHLPQVGDRGALHRLRAARGPRGWRALPRGRRHHPDGAHVGAPRVLRAPPLRITGPRVGGARGHAHPHPRAGGGPERSWGGAAGPDRGLRCAARHVRRARRPPRQPERQQPPSDPHRHRATGVAVLGGVGPGRPGRAAAGPRARPPEHGRASG